MAAVQASQKENMPAIAAHGPMFSSGELKMMLGQCLKMASENKITASNTWGLPLIEHLDDLIKEDDPNKHTNFQRASRPSKFWVVWVRAAGPGEEGGGELGDGGVEGENVSPSKRKRRGELNPEATLEPTLEALNVKKFDLAFAVDPLFHKTSAQFDEGGAKGLLLNNLSVYRGCEIVFDSMDVPEAAVDEAANTAISSAKVDLDVVKPQLEAVLRRSRTVKSMEERLTPTLDDILSIIGSAPKNTAAADADEFVRSVAEGVSAFDVPIAVVSPKGGSPASGAGFDVEGTEGADSAAAEMMQTEEAAAPYANDDDFGGGYDGGYDDYDDIQNQQQQYCAGGNGDDVEMTQQEGFALAGEMPLASSSLQEDAISWLISAGNSNGTASGSSYVTASKGWAGASHWRYRAVPPGKDAVNGTGEDGDEDGVDNLEFGRSKKRGGGGARKRNEPLDFVALMAKGAEEPEFEMLPRGNSGRRTTRRTKKTAAKTLLPEDYHYTSEFLGRYALRPRTAVAISASNGRGGDDFTVNNSTTDGFNDFGSGFDDHVGDDFGDDGNGGDAYGGEWDGGAFASLGSEMNVGDDLDIAQASHRVEKVEVNYSRAAKQVDVRYLKELMWNGIQTVVAQHAANGMRKGVSPDDPIEFADVLATVPENNPAGRIEDLSIHLCFICVLHLANEHGLVVRGVPELNKMQISNIVGVSV
ncbi:hypothetical protein Ndes2437B_g03686 [Nannochloris sp. 'desiccata']